MFLHLYIDGETMKAQVRTKCMFPQMFPQLSTFR
jgi:hypothetical protein